MSEPVARRVTKQATIYDVAQLAGVSHQTVSRHLKGFPGIRPETRERVEHALARLDYRPNMTARTLATSRSQRMGALTHATAQVGPSAILQGAIAGARDAGYVLDVVSLDVEDAGAIHDALSTLMRQDLAGLMAFTSTDAMARVMETTPFSVPTVVEVEDDDADPHANRRKSSNAFASSALVDHLVELGHRRFFHIAGPLGWVAARNRELAFTEALSRHGLVSTGTLHGDWSAESGYAAGMRIPIELGVTAVIVANDQMALGALLALERRGLRVPADVSVAGIDDIPEAAFFHPPLTTVHLEFERQGRAIVDRLLHLIDRPAVSHVSDHDARLVVRESTARAPR